MWWCASLGLDGLVGWRWFRFSLAWTTLVYSFVVLGLVFLLGVLRPGAVGITNASQAHYIHITSRRLYGKHTLALYGILYHICHYQMRTRVCAPIALGFLSDILSFHISSCIDVYSTPLVHTAIQSSHCLYSAHYIILHVVISGILPI